MLLRTARHGIPPVITLDSLIPRTLPCRGALRTTTSTSQPSHLPSCSRRSASTNAPPSSSSNVTPGTILAHLDRQLDEKDLAGLTSAQVEAFNSAIPNLRRAFNRRDLEGAWRIWTTLKERNLLAFFRPLQYDVCARSVLNFCKHTPYSQLHDRHKMVMREVALFCAVGGWTDGLKALMYSAIKDGKPEDTLALYEQYLARLQEKDVQGDAEGSNDPVAEEGAPEEDEPPSLSPVRDEILLAAVVAHIQRGSFTDALQTRLSAESTRIAPSTVQEATRILSHHPLHRKLTSGIHLVNTAALLARPPALMKHLNNLVRDSADKSLERLYSTAIAGATGAHPWLAIKPAELSQTRLVLLPDFFWSSFLKGFLDCRRTDLAERLWDDMLKLRVKPDIATWNALLDGYGNLRLLGSVLSTWSSMSAQGVKPDALSHRALIVAYFDAAKVDVALDHFHTFERVYLEKGASMEDSTVLAVYNTTINELLFASREQEALAIKEKMQQRGPKPDVTTYNTLLRYYGRKGDLKTVARVLEELEPAGVAPDIYTFSTLLSSLLKVRPDADQIVMNFMKKQGVVPDTTTLTSIIDHQLKECTPENFKIAMNLLAKMERGVYGDAQPNAITYTSVLTAINRGNWLDRQTVEEYSRRVWETMQNKGMQPSRAAYNVLLRASLANGEPEGLENAMRYYRDMVRQRVHIGNDTWYILLKGLMDRKQWELAGEVVQDMRRQSTGSMPSSL